MTIGESLRRDLARRSRFAASSAETTHACDVCGRPVSRGRSTSNPRKRHDACRRANYWLEAAVRVLKRLEADQQRAARRRLFLAANALVTPKARDARGRFVPGARP